MNEKTNEENNISKEELDKRIDFFKNKVKYYFFDVFHLYDFDLTIDSQKNYEVCASCYWHNINDGAGMISMYYSIHWISNEETTYEEIEKTAFHETWEAILSELSELSTERFISKKDLPNAVHRVIRRMENIIYPLLKKS